MDLVRCMNVDFEYYFISEALFVNRYFGNNIPLLTNRGFLWYYYRVLSSLSQADSASLKRLARYKKIAVLAFFAR